MMLLFAYVSELSQVKLSLWKAIYVPNDIKSQTSCTIRKYRTIGCMIVMNVWQTLSMYAGFSYEMIKNQNEKV